MKHTFTNNSCSGIYRTYGTTVLNIPGLHEKLGPVTVTIDIPDSLFADVVSYLKKNHKAVVIDGGDMAGGGVVPPLVINSENTEAKEPDVPAPDTNATEKDSADTTGNASESSAGKPEDTDTGVTGKSDDTEVKEESENTGNTETAAADTTEPKATEIEPKPAESVKAEPAKVEPAPAPAPAPTKDADIPIQKRPQVGRPPGRGRNTK